MKYIFNILGSHSFFIHLFGAIAFKPLLTIKNVVDPVIFVSIGK